MPSPMSKMSSPNISDASTSWLFRFIGRECYPSDSIGMPFERRSFSSCCGIPESDRMAPMNAISSWRNSLADLVMTELRPSRL